MQMWSTLLELRRFRRRENLRRLDAHFLRSRLRRGDDPIRVDAGFGSKELLGPVREITRVGTAQHEQEPSKARGIMPTTLSKGLLADPKPIRGCEIDPRNGPDLSRKAPVIELRHPAGMRRTFQIPNSKWKRRLKSHLAIGKCGVRLIDLVDSLALSSPGIIRITPLRTLEEPKIK